MTSRFDLPVFPIYDTLPLESSFSDEILEWFLERGTFYSYQGGSLLGRDYYEIVRDNDAYILCIYPPHDTFNLFGLGTAEKPCTEHRFSSLQGIRMFLTQKHILFTEGGNWWKWSCSEDMENGVADEEGKKLLSPQQLGLPTFPLWDDMPLSRAYPLNELEWLLEHGLIERHCPPCPTGEQSNARGIHQEMARDEDLFCLIDYAPEYRGDDHNQDLVTIRKYDSLLHLLKEEHIEIDRLAECEKEEQWHWTFYKPAAIANGGHL